MSVRLPAGLGNFSQPVMGAKRKPGVIELPKTAPHPANRNRDTVELSYQNVLTAQNEGFIEVNGQKFSVSEEMSKEIAAAYERVAAYNRASTLWETIEQNAEATKQQIKAITEQAKAMAKAMEIYRRIASGGRVPPQDENFLQNFSPELYTAAKMAALTAREHKDYDSVLEDEEAPTEESGAESGESDRQQVTATVSGGDVPAVESVSTASVDASAL